MPILRRTLGGALASAALFLLAAPAQAGDAAACAEAAERAQPLRRAGSLGAARAQLLVCARKECPRVVRKDCEGWLADVDRSMPTVAFRVEGDHGEPVPDAIVTLDGVAVTPGAAAAPVDPGAHTARFKRPGGPETEARVAVQAGEKDRVVVLRFPPAPAPAPHAEGPAPRPVVGWVIGGVGLAALTAAAGLWISGTLGESHLRSTCGVSHSCSQADVDAARRKLIAGDIVAGIGVAAVVTGGALLLFYKPSPKPGVALTLSPSPWGASLGLAARF